MAKELNLTGFCRKCGKNLSLVGRAHNCHPLKVMPGSAESGFVHVTSNGTVEAVDVVYDTRDVDAALKKRGRPRKTPEGFDKAEWQREYMRKRRAKKAEGIVDMATDSVPTDVPEERQGGKDPAAVSLGRRGGLKGGRARANALSPSERKAIAKKAAQARWKVGASQC
jgi:hypothetical protein